MVTVLLAFGGDARPPHPGNWPRSGASASPVVWTTLASPLGLLAAAGGSDVAALIERVERVADGETDVTFDLERDDQLGELAAALDSMADAVDGRESALEQRIEYQQEVLDAIDDVFYVLDRDGEYRQWNATLGEVTGYDPETVAQMGPLDYFEGEDRAAIAAAIDRAFEEGQLRIEADLQTADGPVPYEWVANRLEAPDGTPVVAGIGRDISERVERERELQRNDRRFEAVFNDPNVLAGVLEPDGTLVRANEQSLERIDADPEDVIGRPFWETPWWEGEPELQSELRDGIERAAGGAYVEYEAHPTGEGSREYASEGTIRPVYDEDGAVASLIVSARDVTERIEREAELRAAHDRMAENNGTLRELYEVGSDRDASLEEKIESVLEIGIERLDLTGAYFSRIDPATDRFEFVHTVGLDDVEPGDVAPFSETFCRETAKSGEVYAISDAPNEGWGDDPAYERWGCDSYIGGRVYVEGELEGTIGFVADDPAATSFTGHERTFVDLASQWIGYELERQRKAQQLEEYVEYTDDILDSLEDVFYVVESDGSMHRWNEALREATGHSNEEIASMDPVEFVVEEDQDAIADAVRETFETGSARTEARIETKDGDAIPYEFVGSLLENPAGEPVLVGIGRDVTERVERERELERTRYLLGQAQEIAHVGGWEFDLRTDPSGIAATDEFYRIHGLEPGADLEVDELLECYHPDDRDRVQRLLNQAIEEGKSYDMEVRLAPTERGDRWIRAIAEPVTEDGEIVAVRGSVQDITDRKEGELTLEALHEVTRGLLAADSRSEIANLVIEATTTVLDAPCIGVYLFDEEAGRLEPAALSAEFERLCTDPDTGFDADDGAMLWDAYVGGEPVEFDAGEVPEAIVDDEGHSGLVVPIGEHGVLLAAAGTGPVAPGDRRVAETIVASMETALDRRTSQVALRANQRELESQNRRLRRQMQITEMIRRVDRSLVGASTREEVETAVCERLVESDDVVFAWIGALDDAGVALDPRAWAGEGHEYLDAVSLSLGAATAEPAARTVRTGDATVVESVVEDVTAEPWRKHALVWDFSSVIAVPLELDEYSFGVLAVYGDEPGAFGDLERSVFEELGESIANAINALEARKALYADEFVELRLRFDSDEDFLGRLAAASGATVEYVGLATHGDDQSRLFFETSGVEPAAVRDVLEELHAVGEYRQIGEPDGATLFEATVAGTVLAAHLVSRGGVPRSMTTEAGSLDVVVDVPTTSDVREFVENLRDAYDSVELLRRRDVSRDVQTRQELVAGLFDGLTERQQEVLRTAFFAGFFEWPRDSTGEDVADLLGVSQPTVNRHLRHALSRLLQQLFEEEPTAVAPA
jgi:PAS domain S-box-containing protein